MDEVEPVTIMLPSAMASLVRDAVDGGDYASQREVVLEALCDWTAKRSAQLTALSALKAEIEVGLADVAEGRIQPFDKARIVERGRRLLAARLPYG